MFSKKALLLSWQEIKPYFIFAALLFFAGLVVGGTPSNATEWIEKQLGALQGIADKVEHSDTPEWTLFLLIVINNVFKSVLTMYLGVIGGLLPAFTLVANGMVMGYLIDGIGNEGHNVWLTVLKSILPHGILELPAIFLSCAFGMRLGLTLIRGMTLSLFGRDNAWGPFVRTAAGSIPALLVVTGALVIAAIIESTVTYWLVK